MSTKTLRKRVALGTVVALGAGLLSLVSITSANAAALPPLVTIDPTSVGVQGSSLASSPLAGSITILQTGTLVLADTGTASNADYFTVSAGAYISAAGTDTTTAGGYSDTSTRIASDQASVNFLSGNYGNNFTVKPTGAAGSTFNIVGYLVKGGTATQVISVTIAGTSVAGTASASKSAVSWIAKNGPTQFITGSAFETNTDLAGASAAQAGKGLFLQIDVKDAYGNAVTKAGALTVTVTDGAIAAVKADGQGSSPIATDGTYTTAVSSAGDAYGNYTAGIFEKTAGTGWAGTVTVSYNGVVLATKTGTIAGYVKKIVLSNNKVVQKGATTSNAVQYHAYDAAGNEIDGSALTLANLTKNTIGTASVVTSITPGALPDVAGGTAGQIGVTGGSAGTSTLVVQYVNPDGSVALSNSLVVNVGGAADTYKVALDKSSYNQGDLAKVTVTFLDSKGNIAFSGGYLDGAGHYDTVTVSNGSTTAPAADAVISSPMMTLVGTLPIQNAPDKNGQLVLTYTVGSTGTFTPGNYLFSADFPTVDAADGAAQTVAYSVANPSAGTSLNDVLKGIVSLIASINKQIAALAKLITPAKKVVAKK